MNRRDFLKNVGLGAASLAVEGCTGAAKLPAGSVRVPSYLKGYEKLYAEDPRRAAMQWFKDAKFGLFVHYCLASLLPRGKDDLIEMAGGKKEDLERLKSEPESEKSIAIKQKLLSQFTAAKFDADFIAGLAVSARMRYVNFTTAHLGRLYMYRTKVTDFTTLNSPAKRDLVAEMAKACEKRNLGLFLYVPPETAQTNDEIIERNHTILRELLTQYGPIAGIWFDGINAYYKNPQLYSRLPETFSLIRSLQPQCLISFKQGAIGDEDFVTPEHKMHPAGRWGKLGPERWEKIFKHKPAEINTTMQECWGRDGVGAKGGWVNDVRARHLTADEVMELLAKARSQNANLLLNTGPLGDGSIHPEDVKILREVGGRIRQNGFPG